MEIAEFVTQASVAGITPEALTALAEKLVGATTGKVLTSIDTAIFTVTGQKKPDGIKTHDFVSSALKNSNLSATEKTAYEKKITELSAANPNIDSLKKDYEAKILGYENASKAHKLANKLEKSVLGMNVAEQFRDAFGDVLEAKISKLLPMIAEKDGELVLVDSDGTVKLNNKGKAILAKTHLLEQLAPFASQQAPPAGGPPPPRVGAPNPQTMSTTELYDFAVKNGINIRTTEGQKAMAALLGNK